MIFGVVSVYCVILGNLVHNNKIPLLHVLLEKNNRAGTFLQQKWP